MLDTSPPFYLENADTQRLYQLVSDGNDVAIDYDFTGSSSVWFLELTSYDDYFRLHTLTNGYETSLDVVSDNGIPSARVHFAQSGDYTSQLWRLDEWGDGTFKLSNNFTGPDVHLDLDLDNGIPYLEPGVGTAKRWILADLDGPATSTITVLSAMSFTTGVPSVIAAHTNTISTTIPTTAPSATPSSSNLAITPPHEHSISLGAIVGVAIGSLAALTLCICAIIYVLRRKQKSAPTSAEQYDDSPPELVSSPPDYVAATSEKKLVPAHVTAQGEQRQGDQQWKNISPAEVVGSPVHHRAEMP